jgi:hypothetical protein
MMSSGRLDSADWRLATRAQSIGGVLGSMHVRRAFGLVCRPTSIVRAMGGDEEECNFIITIHAPVRYSPRLVGSLYGITKYPQRREVRYSPRLVGSLYRLGLKCL